MGCTSCSRPRTGSSAPNVPMMVSNSLTDCEGPAIDAMPVLPPWADVRASPGRPTCSKVGGRYVMWFNAGAGVARLDGHQVHRRGHLEADPVGPYTLEGHPAPLVCQLDHLGSIDPRAFVDPADVCGCCGSPTTTRTWTATTHTTIYAQQLTADGLSPVGQPGRAHDRGPALGGPDRGVAGHGRTRLGHYWLFFSGNWFNQPAYAIGVAECAGPDGPCEPTTPRPVAVGSNAQGSGPRGGVAVLRRVAMVDALSPRSPSTTEQRHAPPGRAGAAGLRPRRSVRGRSRDHRLERTRPGRADPSGLELGREACRRTRGCTKAGSSRSGP